MGPIAREKHWETGMKPVRMYCTAYCPYCMRADHLLMSKGVEINKLRVDLQPDLWAKMQAESGRDTVPQIWIGDVHVGGFTDLLALEQKGELDALFYETSA